MNTVIFQKMAMLCAITLSSFPVFARCIMSPRPMISRTCPCNMVPSIDERTDVEAVIKAFKDARPRSQRAQLVGFIKQYVSKLDAKTQEVMIKASRVYSDRMNSNKVYNLVQDLVKAEVKEPAQAKAMLALGKVLRALTDTEHFSCDTERGLDYEHMPLTQLKTHIARWVADYIENPSQELEEILHELAQVYCQRVGSQAINHLISKLFIGSSQTVTQEKIMQTLGIR